MAFAGDSGSSAAAAAATALFPTGTDVDASDSGSSAAAAMAFLPAAAHDIASNSGISASATSAMSLLPAVTDEDEKLLKLEQAVQRLPFPMRSVDKKLFMDQFARYRKASRERADGSCDGIDARLVDRATPEVYHQLPLPPNAFTRVKSLLKKLIVLKVVRSPNSSENPRESMHICSISKQLEALNREYGGDIPLILAGNVYNEEYIKNMSMELSSQNLTVVYLVQSIFPFVRLGTTFEPVQKIATSLGATDRWYAPGDGDILSSLFRNNKFIALSKEKKFLFFLSGETCDPIVDIKILNHLETRKFDFCIEATHGYGVLSSCQDLDRAIVSVDGHLKLIDRMKAKSEASPEEADKYLCWNTNNMWVGLEVLQDLSDKKMLNLQVVGKDAKADEGAVTMIETRAASAVEYFKNPMALVIPTSRRLYKDTPFPQLKKLHSLMFPTFTDKLKLKILGSIFLFYFIYHATLVLVSGSLEVKFESEVARTWLEGLAWVFILLAYLFILYKRSARRVRFPLDPEDRVAEMKADSFQVGLHGFTRLVYVGMLKQATHNEWFANPWSKYATIHALVAIFLEVPGSYCIERFIGFGFKEPVEV